MAVVVIPQAPKSSQMRTSRTLLSVNPVSSVSPKVRKNEYASLPASTRRVQASAFGARNCLPIGHRPACGTIPVAAVGASAQHHAALPGNLLRGVKSERLIASAHAGARDGARYFPAHHQADGLPLVRR